MKPVVINGRTLLPIRSIIEKMGGTVDWSEEEQKVTIEIQSNRMDLWIGQNDAKINEIYKHMDVAPVVINNRTMLPLRFIVENIGCDVEWDAEKQEVSIIY